MYKDDYDYEKYKLVYFGYNIIGTKLLRGECYSWKVATHSDGFIFDGHKAQLHYKSKAIAKDCILKIKLSCWKEDNYFDYILSETEMLRAITYKVVK